MTFAVQAGGENRGSSILIPTHQLVTSLHADDSFGSNFELSQANGGLWCHTVHVKYSTFVQWYDGEADRQCAG